MYYKIYIPPLCVPDLTTGVHGPPHMIVIETEHGRCRSRDGKRHPRSSRPLTAAPGYPDRPGTRCIPRYGSLSREPRSQVPTARRSPPRPRSRPGRAELMVSGHSLLGLARARADGRRRRTHLSPSRNPCPCSMLLEFGKLVCHLVVNT